MRKLSEEIANRYPVVAVFFAEDTGRFKAGVHVTHLIRSNGVSMLCCDDDGEVHIIPLSVTAKVSTRSNDDWVCRFDAMTGHIVYRRPNAPETFSTGPIKGCADPTIDLAATAKALGLDYDDIINGKEPLEPNTPSVRGLTTDQIIDGPAERSVEEILKLDNEDDEHAMLSDEEMAVPDLSDMDLEDDFETDEDFGLDREHRGRVSGD